jgi:cytochrome c-type biogenesis protein CcmH/NrfG
MGEAYMKDGQKILAIKSYEKSLQLDPNKKNAEEMLKQLQSNNN